MMNKVFKGFLATALVFGFSVSCLAADADEEEREEARAALEAARMEMEAAREALRDATRAMADAYGNLHVETPRAYAYSFMSNPRKAMIGVVAEPAEGGLELVGVTPDGPAEQAGLQVGDLLVSVNGEKLVVDDFGEMGVLLDQLADVEVGDDVSIVYVRDGVESKATVIAERREPFAWYDVIDGEDIGARISEAMEDFEVRFSDMEMDVDDMHYSFDTGANVVIDRVFGLGGLHELELASMNEGLASYFGTSEGVLVLAAPEDNHWQLKSGDVLLAVDGREVTNPSRALRILRSYESGDSVELQIMRDKSRANIGVTVPELDVRFGPHRETVKVIQIDKD